MGLTNVQRRPTKSNRLRNGNGKRTWKAFLKAHRDCLDVIDCTAIKVWTKGGLVTYSLLFVMAIATRRVCFATCRVQR